MFRVFLPLTVEEVPRQPEKATKALNLKGGGTVLVVDDEPMVRNMAQAMLGSLGFEGLMAANGVEAVEVFREHRDEIRFVLCDLTMPRMDGWETLTALRQIQPGIPVILASGYDEASVMKGEHPEWPQAFLSKPYGLKELREAIGQALARKAEG